MFIINAVYNNMNPNVIFILCLPVHTNIEPVNQFIALRSLSDQITDHNPLP